MPGPAHRDSPRTQFGSTGADALPFVPRDRRWALARHLIAALIAGLALMAAWVVVSAPFALVLIIDSTDDSYPEFVAWSAGVVAGTMLVVAPVAAGVERLVLRGHRAGIVLGIVLVPGALLAAIAGYGGLMAFVDSTRMREFGMLGVLAMLALAAYWPVLWGLNLAGYLLRRYRSGSSSS